MAAPPLPCSCRCRKTCTFEWDQEEEDVTHSLRMGEERLQRLPRAASAKKLCRHRRSLFPPSSFLPPLPSARVLSRPIAHCLAVQLGVACVEGLGTTAHGAANFPLSIILSLPIKPRLRSGPYKVRISPASPAFCATAVTTGVVRAVTFPLEGVGVVLLRVAANDGAP